MLTPTSFPPSKPELIGGGSRGASVADVGFASTNPGRAISALGRACCSAVGLDRQVCYEQRSDAVRRPVAWPALRTQFGQEQSSANGSS